jgi:hypothetical protein
MGLFKSKSNSVKKHDGKRDGRPEKGDQKKVKYVYLSSKKAVFLVTGDIKKSKYSYSVPIIPLHGIYYSSKEKRKYTAKELVGYFVVLNIDEEDANVLKGKKIVVLGYSENEALFVPANEKERGDGNDGNKA